MLFFVIIHLLIFAPALIKFFFSSIIIISVIIIYLELFSIFVHVIISSSNNIFSSYPILSINILIFIIISLSKLHIYPCYSFYPQSISIFYDFIAILNIYASIIACFLSLIINLLIDSNSAIITLAAL